MAKAADTLTRFASRLGRSAATLADHLPTFAVARNACLIARGLSRRLPHRLSAGARNSKIEAHRSAIEKKIENLPRDQTAPAVLTQTLFGPTDWNPPTEQIGPGLEDEINNPRRRLTQAEVSLMVASLRDRLGDIESDYRDRHADVLQMADRGLEFIETGAGDGTIHVFHRESAGAYLLVGGRELPAFLVMDAESEPVRLFVSSASMTHAPALDLQALLGLFHEGLEAAGRGHAMAAMLEGLLDPELVDDEVAPDKIGMSPRFFAQRALMNEQQLEKFTNEHEEGAVEVRIRTDIENRSLSEAVSRYALAHAEAMHEASKHARRGSDSKIFDLDAMNHLKGRDARVMSEILKGQIRFAGDYQRQQAVGLVEGFLSEVGDEDALALGVVARLADTGHQEHLLGILSRTNRLEAQGVLIEALGRIGTSHPVLLMLRGFIERTEPDIQKEYRWFFLRYRDRAHGLRMILKAALRNLARRGFGEDDLDVDLELIEDQERRSDQGMPRYSWGRGSWLAGGMAAAAMVGSYLIWDGAQGSRLSVESFEPEESAPVVIEQSVEPVAQNRTEARKDLQKVYHDIPYGFQRPLVEKEIVPFLEPFRLFDPATDQSGTNQGTRSVASISRYGRGVAMLDGRRSAGFFITDIRNGLGRSGDFQKFGPVRIVPVGTSTGEVVEQKLVTLPMRAGERIRLPLPLDGRFSEVSASLGSVLSLSPEGWLSAHRYIDTRELSLSIEILSRNGRVEASQPDTPWLRKERRALRENSLLAPIRQELADAKRGSLQARGEALVRLSQKYLGYSRVKRVRMDSSVVNSWMDLLAEIVDRDGRFYADSDVLHTITFVWARFLAIDAVYAVGFMNGNGDAVLTDHEGHAALILKLDEDESKNPWQMLDITRTIPQSDVTTARAFVTIGDPRNHPAAATGRVTAAKSSDASSRPSRDERIASAGSAKNFDPRGQTVQIASEIRRSPVRPTGGNKFARPKSLKARPRVTAVDVPPDSFQRHAGGRSSIPARTQLPKPPERVVSPARKIIRSSDANSPPRVAGYFQGLEAYIVEGVTRSGARSRQKRRDEERRLFFDYGAEWYMQRLANFRMALAEEYRYPNASTNAEFQALREQRSADGELSPEGVMLLLAEVSRELGVTRFQQPERIDILEEIIEIGKGILADANIEPSFDESVLVDVETDAGSFSIQIRFERLNSRSRESLELEVSALLEELGARASIAEINSGFQKENSERILIITARNQSGQLIGVNLAYDFLLVDRESFTWLSHRVATTSANLEFPDHVLFQSFVGVREEWRSQEVLDVLRDMLVQAGKARNYAYILSQTRLNVDFEQRIVSDDLARGEFVIGHTFEHDGDRFVSQYFIPLERLDELEKKPLKNSGIRVLKKMVFGQNRLFSLFWESQEDHPELLYVVVSDPVADRKVSGFWLHAGNRLELLGLYPELGSLDLASPNSAGE